MVELQEKVRLLENQISRETKVNEQGVAPIDSKVAANIGGEKGTTFGNLIKERVTRRKARLAKLEKAISDPNRTRLIKALNEYSVIRLEESSFEGVTASDNDLVGVNGMRKTVQLDKPDSEKTEADKIAQRSTIKIRFKEGHKLSNIQNNELLLPTLSLTVSAARTLSKTKEGGPLTEQALRSGLASILTRSDVLGMGDDTGKLITDV